MKHYLALASVLALVCLNTTLAASPDRAGKSFRCAPNSVTGGNVSGVPEFDYIDIEKAQGRMAMHMYHGDRVVKVFPFAKSDSAEVTDQVLKGVWSDLDTSIHLVREAPSLGKYESDYWDDEYEYGIIYEEDFFLRVTCYPKKDVGASNLSADERLKRTVESNLALIEKSGGSVYVERRRGKQSAMNIDIYSIECNASTFYGDNVPLGTCLASGDLTSPNSSVALAISVAAEEADGPGFKNTYEARVLAREL
jgi:hypothetical protein